MKKLQIQDLNLDNKKVLVRIDFNVPIDEDGSITDTTRIDMTLDTIQYLIDKNAKIILMSHLGRPKNREEKYSLKRCGQYLAKILNKPILLTSDCIGEETKKAIDNMQQRDIILLENLRFHEEETHPLGHSSFSKELASFADYYVNDAFATAHRKHSSTYYVPKILSLSSAAGFLLQKEIKELSKCFSYVQKPFYAIIGGSKVSSKIGILESLVNKADAIFIGGAMTFTFLKALGKSVGSSKIEEDHIQTAILFLDKCKKKGIQVHLPLDIVYAEEFHEDSSFYTLDIQSAPNKNQVGVDIGEKTVEDWKGKLENAKTIFWNGPLGVFEWKNFSKGTFTIAKILADSSAITVVGGGDSVSAINELKLSKKFTHISSGGGASLEFIEKGSLPCIEILTSKQ